MNFRELKVYERILEINLIFQNEKTVQLVMEAECFSWHLIDAAAYDQVINWHVMSCDPRVILCLDGDLTHPIDSTVNK